MVQSLINPNIIIIIIIIFAFLPPEEQEFVHAFNLHGRFSIFCHLKSKNLFVLSI